MESIRGLWELVVLCSSGRDLEASTVTILTTVKIAEKAAALSEFTIAASSQWTWRRWRLNARGEDLSLFSKTAQNERNFDLRRRRPRFRRHLRKKK